MLHGVNGLTPGHTQTYAFSGGNRKIIHKICEISLAYCRINAVFPYGEIKYFCLCCSGSETNGTDKI